MIESVEFRNYKVLKDTTLSLDRFTLIAGPNNSGKSTALEALEALHDPRRFAFDKIVTVGLQPTDETPVKVEVVLHWGGRYKGTKTEFR
ncbi:MAG: AAA family ATPase [Candidatus Bipolaricaulia bacterium]